ncbi:hypothetical protein TWF481_003599 [Arthrobotrys musiformis]|uniref:Uncharacterized protein n=1 Tax=Arthrobotrys musiformis TaxID=47236 RepID=A0AAV9WHZ1_9PEZI
MPALSENKNCKKALTPSYTHVLPQTLSPLFKLPGEIRNLIWEYALAPYNDSKRAYPAWSRNCRPDYWGSPKSDTALLRTCKAVHKEAWHFTWVTSELCFFRGGGEHRHIYTDHGSTHQGKLLEAIHGIEENITIRHMRIFAKTEYLEEDGVLQSILDTKYAEPRTVTITIRHADFTGWREDHRLRVDGNWVRKCRFPDSVETIRVEFESVERKCGQVDEIAEQAVEKWEFERRDGRKLSATVRNPEGEMETMWWAGEGNLDGVRWIRDIGEDGKIWYFVKAVVWRIKEEDPRKEEEAEGSRVDDYMVDETNRDPDITLSVADTPSSTHIPLDQIQALPEADVTQMVFALRSLELASGRWQNSDHASGDALREMVSIWRQMHPRLFRNPARDLHAENSLVEGSCWFGPEVWDYFVPDSRWGGVGHHDDDVTPLWKMEDPELPEAGEEPWPLHRVGRNRKVPKLVW